MAVLFALLYVGLPLGGRMADAALGLPETPAPIRWLGVPLLGVGVVGLGWSLASFARHGGTPNPIAPPTSLVTTGPFAWTRNPIIVSHALGLLGVSLLVGSVAATAIVFVLGLPSQALVRHEERVLEARFGDGYRAYRDTVPRWLPRRPRHS
jgi:protein-S-isoprenylcysteine O-methyltransferase Ste14